MATAPQKAHDHTLFLELLGGKAHLEVNLSKAFAACFRDSTAFRSAVLNLLCTTCGTSGPQEDARWVCQTEIALAGSGRADIQLRSEGTARPHIFQIENKLAAPLTTHQLLRYRKTRDGRRLIAITKRRPEVAKAWIRKHGAFLVRWQDVHRALSAVTGKGQDRYLCQSFCRYLEELGMAHREDIRHDDLTRLHKFFNIAASRARYSSFEVRNSFEVADSCSAILEDVIAEAREAIPKFSKLSILGPAYMKHINDDDVDHELGFRFHRNWQQFVGAGFMFSVGGGAHWQVSEYVKKTDSWRGVNRQFASICDRTGVVDREKMLKSFVTWSRKVSFLS